MQRLSAIPLVLAAVALLSAQAGSTWRELFEPYRIMGKTHLQEDHSR